LDKLNLKSPHGDHANSNKLSLYVLKIRKKTSDRTVYLLSYVYEFVTYLRIKICDLSRMSLDQSLLLAFYSVSLSTTSSFLGTEKEARIIIFYILLKDDVSGQVVKQ
jgi:hypothetical protein